MVFGLGDFASLYGESVCFLITVHRIGSPEIIHRPSTSEECPIREDGIIVDEIATCEEVYAFQHMGLAGAVGTHDIGLRTERELPVWAPTKVLDVE